MRRLIKSVDLLNQNSVDFAYADLKSNFNFRGYLRPIWPLVPLGCQNTSPFVIYLYFFKSNIETDAKKGFVVPEIGF